MWLLSVTRHAEARASGPLCASPAQLLLTRALSEVERQKGMQSSDKDAVRRELEHFRAEAKSLTSAARR